jgi:hypothetical protein
LRAHQRQQRADAFRPFGLGQHDRFRAARQHGGKIGGNEPAFQRIDPHEHRAGAIGGEERGHCFARLVLGSERDRVFEIEITASAPLAAALAKRSGRSAGTNSSERSLIAAPPRSARCGGSDTPLRRAGSPVRGQT